MADDNALERTNAESGNEGGPSPPVWSLNSTENSHKVFLARFDYAWKWFDFHAQQRMQLFNFFLIITGIEATAFASAYEKELHFINVAVCLIGIIGSIGFITFDIRSREMTRIAEHILHELERIWLFVEAPGLGDRTAIPGPMHMEDARRMREGYSYKRGFLVLLKMKTWIRLVELCVLAAFVAGLILTLRRL